LELKGKLVFGIAGLFIGDQAGLPFGGLTGFILGSILGHFLFDQPKENAAKESVHKAYQKRKGAFIYHVFALCAKMAKSDGIVSKNEVSLMEQLMRQQFKLSDRGRAEAIRVWKQAKDSMEPFERFARAFYDDFNLERHQVLNMMDLLFAMAAADGNLHPRKEELLLRAAGVFHISRMQYDRIKSRHFQPPPNRRPSWQPLDPYYAILGAQPGEPTDAIKQKFRSLAMQWHPDKVTARGASTEALRHAKEKFQKINEAYEKILEARKVG
jgi:DnaJ like chaperone protein